MAPPTPQAVQALSTICRRLHDDSVDLHTASQVAEQAEAALDDDPYYHVLSATIENAANSLQNAVHAVSARVPGVAPVSVHP